MVDGYNPNLKIYYEKIPIFIISIADATIVRDANEFNCEW